MPFTIVRNDITHMQVDAIVNTANPHPVVGAGVDAAIHAAAGPALLQARQTVGPIAPGHCAITRGFGLSARYVIHAVGPAWQDGHHGEEALLRSCYANALHLAHQHSLVSVAFPLISAGTYAFPHDRALQVAVSAISDFLLHHEMEVYLVVYDRRAFRLSGRLFADVASYIDENYVEQHSAKACRAERRRREAARLAPSDMSVPLFGEYAVQEFAAPSLGDLLLETDAGFSETLLKLISRTGEKDSAVYKRANISRQHFSKIRNDPAYQPTKYTALAFAVALRLDLAETRDLLERAGFALSRSNLGDMIVQYFIERGHYDINDINIALFDHDQPQLGS